MHPISRPVPLGPSRRSILPFLLVMGAFLAAPSWRAQAADYPERPIVLVVPFAPGGANDITARLIADPLGEALGQRVVIENRGGAGGNIGIGAVARAQPDGYTLLLASSGFTVNPSLYPQIPYDAVKDFEPVADLTHFPLVFAAHPDTGIRSLADLVDRARKNPGKLNYASAGTGTATHLGAELFKLRAKLDIVHVPYSGAAPAVQGLLTKSVEIGSMSISSTLAQIQAGGLVPLAVTSAERWPDLPDVPTLTEAGVADAVTETWQGVLVPAGTPKEIIERLAQELVKVIKRPDIREKLRVAGYNVSGRGPEDFRALIKEELPKWKEVITTAGIKGQ